MPAHNHDLLASTDPAEQAAPGPNRALARSTPGSAYAASDSATAAPEAISAAGGDSPHNNMPPVLPLELLHRPPRDLPAAPMSAPPPAIALRPATPEDRPFLLGVYASTREQELAQVPFTPEQKAAFLAQQFEAQSVHYARHYGDASFDVVEVDGVPAGRLIVARWRAASCGSSTSRCWPPSAAAGSARGCWRRCWPRPTPAASAIAIHVEHDNPAQRLYRAARLRPRAGRRRGRLPALEAAAGRRSGRPAGRRRR